MCCKPANKKKKTRKSNRSRSLAAGREQPKQRNRANTYYHQEIPVYDYAADHDLDTDWGLAECLGNLVFSIKYGDFLRWEPVVTWEKRLPLTQKQEEALDELISIRSPVDVIPAEILHRLWLQYAFDAISGIGQEEELTLENDKQRPWRIENFIDSL